MFDMDEEVIEIVGNAPTPKEVENIVKSMSNKQCLQYLEKAIKEANAMNHGLMCSENEFLILQAVLIYVKTVVKNNMEEE